jgi:gamma-glutamylputrescine oxidase
MPEAIAGTSGDPPGSVDVAVVGAGLTGLSCAYHVLRDNPAASVVVLEASHLGNGASGHSTGMVTPGIGQNYARLVKRLGGERAGTLYRETREAVRYAGELIALEGIDCDHEVVGQLIVAHGKAGGVRLALQAEALEATGQPFTRLDAKELSARVKLERGPATAVAAALYLPDAAILDPLLLVHGLARAVESRGGSVHCHARVQTIKHGATAILRLTSGSTVRARSVVVATASESLALTGLTGRVMPICLKVLATNPLSQQQLAAIGWRNRECIVDSRRLFNYFRLSRDNRIVFGGGVPAYGTVPARPSADLLNELLRTFAPELALEIAREWHASIDYTLDGLPVVGGPSSGNVIYAGGFCGHGIALGIRSGSWIAAMIAGRPSSCPRHVLRRTAPRVPGEWLRRASFSIASNWMKLRGV